MRLLKNRPVSFSRPPEPRNRRLAVIRWVYILTVLALLIWFLDSFFGDLFYLRSEGMVIGQSSVVAAEFPVRVREILVREGDSVTSGQIVVLATSQEVLTTRLSYGDGIATRKVRISDLRIRQETINDMLVLANNRDEVAGKTQEKYDELVKQGYLSLDKRMSTLEMEYQSRLDQQVLVSELRANRKEIDIQTTELAKLESMLNDYNGLFDQGQLRAPIGGIVSRVLADKGSVVLVGSALVEIYGNEHYVLAYVPTGGLYSLNVGDEVEINSGLLKLSGRIARIEPYAAALPREFQRSFIPVERQQVIRVEFEDNVELPPLFTKVEMRSASIVPKWMSSLWSDVQKRLGRE